MSRPFAELRSVAEFVNGAAFKPNDWEQTGKKIIRIQNLTDARKPFNRTTRVVPDRLYVRPGDILVSWSASLGVFEWTEPDIAVLNQHIFRVIPDQSKIDKRYLRHGLVSALREMRKHLHGATMQHVNRDEFLSTQIYVPNLSEQKRIATVLDKVDELRAKRRAAMLELDELAQAMFVDMFGDPSDSGNRERLTTLENVCHKIVDGTHKTPTYTDSGVPFVTVRNIATGELILEGAKFITAAEHALLTKRVRPELGDILVSKDGTIGVACPVRTSTAFSIFVSVALLKVKRDVVDPLFLTQQFRTDWMQSQIRAGTKGIAIRHLHLGDFNKLRVLVPLISLQREYVRRVAQVERLRAGHHESHDSLNALFISLQHRAFNGEL